ncbi:MAG: hypothetical protein L0226_06045 [Acidobacteria bacterium]|nr:hypothetical protein [Acidobacteriota bacterium]
MMKDEARAGEQESGRAGDENVSASSLVPSSSLSEPMFETEVDRSAERARSRAFLVIGAIAVLFILALIMMLSSLRRENLPMLRNVVRAGSPEFDAYKDKVELEITGKITHPNMIGMFQLEVRAKLHNRGARMLTGVEVLGKMLDMNDKVISSNTSIPIPRIREEPLKPGESLSFSVKVDAPSRVQEHEVKDITIELRGLQF